MAIKMIFPILRQQGIGSFGTKSHFHHLKVSMNWRCPAI